MKVKDYSDRGVSLSNLPMEKLVSDLLNFWPNDVLIVTVCPGDKQFVCPLGDKHFSHTGEGVDKQF